MPSVDGLITQHSLSSLYLPTRLSYCISTFYFLTTDLFYGLFETAFKDSSPVSNYYFLYFLANDKNPRPLTYYLDLGSIEYHGIIKLEQRLISV